MTRRKLIACMALLCTPTLAADYAVDPMHTFPALEFSHMGISTWRGSFNKTSGKEAIEEDVAPESRRAHRAGLRDG